MADICDRAQKINDLWLCNQIKRQQQSQSRYDSSLESLAYCAECGEPIPEARRKSVPGCRLCVNCQEKRDRQYKL